MHTFANRQKGRAIGVEGVTAGGTLDNRRQTDGNTKENDPGSKQLAHGAARSLHLKSDDQTGYVDQDGCPQDPAAVANLCQPRPEGSKVPVFLLTQEGLPVLVVMNLPDPLELLYCLRQLVTDPLLLLGDDHLEKEFVCDQVDVGNKIRDQEITDGKNFL